MNPAPEAVKAAELANIVEREGNHGVTSIGWQPFDFSEPIYASRYAFARYIREVSDAVALYERGAGDFSPLRAFILPKKPDPLVEAIKTSGRVGTMDYAGAAEQIRRALTAAGYELRPIKEKPDAE